MRILVTGCHGQVARALIECGGALGHDVIALGRPEFDLSEPAEAIITVIAARRADVVVNAAAYTAVDAAEGDVDAAFAVNAAGAEAVARAARSCAVPMVHLSTDYVFDGTKPSPYVETDPTGPTGVYGRTKLAGEQAVMAAHDDSVVLRTAWVYSAFGHNFVKTMLRLAAERDTVRVVADQCGNPTSAHDIARAIVSVAGTLVSNGDPALRGVFHMAGTGDASWADLAEAVFAASVAAGGPGATVDRIASAEFPTAARRPSNSRLDCAKLAGLHGLTLPDWRHSTVAVTARLVEESRPPQGK